MLLGKILSPLYTFFQTRVMLLVFFRCGQVSPTTGQTQFGGSGEMAVLSLSQTPLS